MTIYIAVPLTDNSEPLNEAVENTITSQADRHKLQADRGWLIRFDGTSVELSNHLGITGQEKGVLSPVGPAFVAPIEGYYGRGSMDMWEWLKTRFES